MKMILFIFAVLFTHNTEASELCDLFVNKPKTIFENREQKVSIKRYTINNSNNRRNGLTVYVATLDPKSIGFKMINVEQLGNIKAIYEQHIDDDILIAVNANYFGYDNNGNHKNLGLIVSNSKVINPVRNWKQGGVFYQDVAGNFKITHISRFNIKSSNAVEAVQSRPIVVYNSKNAIRSDDGKKRNRTALGIDKNGNVVVVFVFNRVTSIGVSLYEMGKLFSANRDNCGLEMKSLLCMDGGSSSFLAIPSRNIYIGSRNYNFVSSIASFFVRKPRGRR